MDEVLADIARELDVPPVDAGLTIEGAKIKVIEGQKGSVVDQRHAARTAQGGARSPFTPRS